MKQLIILLTNISIADRSGTEVNIRDLAFGLKARGHRPIVYSPHIGHGPKLGPIPTELRAATIPVVDDIAQMEVTPDIIHGNHNSPIVTAMTRFPMVPTVFWCHDWLAWHDAPPLLPGIRRYVAVDDTNRDRLVIENGIPEKDVRVVLNAVDLARFQPRGGLPPRPRRALVFTRHAGHLATLRAACAAAGIELDEAISDNVPVTNTPETLLPKYDLVFAAARGALEALAVGTAVIACDARGLAGLVTTGNVDQLRRLNFGVRALCRALTRSELAAEISAYDAADAAAVTQRIRATAGLEQQLDAFEGIYAEVLEEHGRVGPPQPEEAARALARHLQQWLPRHDGRWPWIIEREHLMEQHDDLIKQLQSPFWYNLMAFTRTVGGGLRRLIRQAGKQNSKE